MNYETIDESQQSVPEKALIEIRGMCGWMTFVGVITIIFSVITILSDLADMSKAASSSGGISFLVNCFSLYIGFLLVNKASAFKSFAESRDEESLKKSLKMNEKYWMLSTVLLIINVLVSLITIF